MVVHSNGIESLGGVGSMGSIGGVEKQIYILTS